MLHDPDILILDEPTSGLDPNQIVEIRSLIKEIGREKTVILSTHILPEVQATCSRILIISGGKLVADGTPDSLRARERGGRYRVVVESNGVVKEAIRDRLAGLAGVARCEMVAGEEGAHAFALDAAAATDLRKPIFRAAVDNRWTLLELLRESASLEDVFRNLTTGDVVAEDQRKGSHDPGAGDLAARDPHLLQLAGGVHRRPGLRHHHRLPVLHPALPGEAGRHARLLQHHAAAVHVHDPGHHDAPPGRREVVAGRWSCSSPCRCVTGRWWSASSWRRWRCSARRIGLTLVFAITVKSLGPLDRGPAIGGYLGLVLMGGAYVAIGVMASSLTRNSIVSFIVAFAISFALYLLGRLTQFLPQALQKLVAYLSIDGHFENIGRGVVDTRDVIYYFSVMAVSLLIATLSLESRRWR